MTVKSEVLKALIENKGKSVSGEEIADRLGVSRTAVWKAVKSLQESNYTIEAVTNKGYMMPGDTDIISAEAVRSMTDFDIPVYYFESVASTNEKAKELAGTEDRAVVIANEQTQGKGRLGRTFVSPAGSGLYMSIIIKPDFDISKSVLITTAASVAVVRALEKLYGLAPEIKWVNDIYLGGRKITGILTEAVMDFESGQIGSIVVGIGVNCFESDSPKAAADSYGFIGGSVSRAAIAAQIINEFIPVVDNIEDRSFIEDYRSHSMVIGKRILVYKAGMLGKPGAKPLHAEAEGIDEDGGLIIKHPDENGNTVLETITSGEVSIRLE